MTGTSTHHNTNKLSYLLLFLFLLPHIASSQCKTSDSNSECLAGCYKSEEGGNCTRCPEDYNEWNYSKDGATECTQCPQIAQQAQQCLCDTTPPENYWNYNNKHGLPPECVRNNCSNECFETIRHMFDASATGTSTSLSDSELFTFIHCECTSNESCTTQRFNHLCLLNDCDRPLNGTINKAILSSCLDYFNSAGKCSNECYLALSEYLEDLRQCHCHYVLDGDQAKLLECQKFKEMYDVCREPPVIHPTHLILVIALLFFVLVSGLYFSVKWYAVRFGRKLKREGNLSHILPFIDWSSVQPIGTPAEVYHDQFFLANREILVKVRFSVLYKSLLPIHKFFTSQHIVIKIFSDTRTEVQNKEMSVFNAITDKIKAKNNNVIRVYGPTKANYQTGVSDFLQGLLRYCPHFFNMSKVITQYYDQRSTCILMNHCNALSLNSFITEKFPGGCLPPQYIVRLCQDLARAINFLHQNNPVVVHCDIKPHNIFVKSGKFRYNSMPSFILGDFGFAELHEQGFPWRLRGGTTAFLPPEYIITQDAANMARFTDTMTQAVSDRHAMPTTVDVYQYGLIMWLVLHGKTDPWSAEYAGTAAREQVAAAREQVAAVNGDPNEARVRFMAEMFLSDFGRRPHFSEEPPANMKWHLYQELKEITEQSWHVDLQQRPSADTILNRVEQLSSNFLTHRPQLTSNRVEDNMKYVNDNRIVLVDVIGSV